ncbi:MAG: hypothetical protein AAFO79_00735 [Pseudomonadota bacterium]
MRFTLPFLLAITALVACVHGANLTAFQASQASSFDILGAVQSIAFRLHRVIGFTPEAAMAVGAAVLLIPAMFTFHAGRLVFGGSTARLRAEGRSMNQERSGIAIDALLERDERLRAGLVTDPVTAEHAAAGPVNYMGDVNQRRTVVDPVNVKTTTRSSEATVRPVAQNEPVRPVAETNTAKSGGRLERFLGKRPDFSALGKQASALKSRMTARQARPQTAQEAAAVAAAVTPAHPTTVRSASSATTSPQASGPRELPTGQQMPGAGAASRPAATNTTALPQTTRDPVNRTRGPLSSGSTKQN